MSLRLFAPVSEHEVADALGSAAPRLAALAQPLDEPGIADRVPAKAGYGDAMCAAESFDVLEKRVHNGDIILSLNSDRQPPMSPKGYVVTFPGQGHSRDMDAEAGLNEARRCLQEALDKGMSQREIARRAGVNPNMVRRILSGHIESPRLVTLARIADALGGDLSLFGLSQKPIQTTLAELQRAIGEALPAMPSPYLGVDTQARYLAEVVAAILELPDDLDSDEAPPPTTPQE
jgi:transcriptional regulator with XRE-family HTH domain